MEKFRQPSRQEKPKSAENLVDADTLRDQLRAHVRDELVNLKNLREKAAQAEQIAGRRIQEAWQKGLDGEEFKGEYITEPKQKAMIAISSLKKETLDSVFAHGVASNRPTTDRDFPINALASILATGILKGDSAPLSGGFNQVVFTDAPFILLSNSNEPLTEIGADSVQRLKHLRTVLVNGQYQDLVDDLRKAFPWVSFRTADQLDDSVFDQKDPIYKSYDERIEDRVQEGIHKRTTGV